MENPLDVTANTSESAAAAIVQLRQQVEALERARTVPATITGVSLAALKAQLPTSAPNNTIVIGQIGSGTERAYLYIYEATAGKWYRSGAFVEA
jgi:hypothetical protein